MGMTSKAYSRSYVHRTPLDALSSRTLVVRCIKRSLTSFCRLKIPNGLFASVVIRPEKCLVFVLKRALFEDPVVICALDHSTSHSSPHIALESLSVVS
jgi:hypothetical protein